MWLYSNDDLKSLYIKCPAGEITLWCDGIGESKGEEHSIVRGKRKKDEPIPSKRHEKEEVEAVFRTNMGKTSLFSDCACGQE